MHGTSLIIFETFKRYWYYVLGHRLLDWKNRLRLRHLEIIHGPDAYMNDEYHWVDDHVLYHRSYVWIRRAYKYHLNLPPRDGDHWTETTHSVLGDPYGTEKVLTNKGVRHLLEQYREEKSARHGQWKLWVTMAASLIAAAGAIKGIFS